MTRLLLLLKIFFSTFISGAETVYYSKSGRLHEINMEVLPSVKRSNLKCLSSTVDITEFREISLNNDRIKMAYVFGGIDYDKSSKSIYNQNSLQANTPDFDLSQFNLYRERNFFKWPFLPGTKVEGREVSTLLESRNISSVLFQGKEAGEDKVKNLSGFRLPFLLHLATHGFLFEIGRNYNTGEEKIYGSITKDTTVSKNQASWAGEPLLRSGLIFSGANKYWKEDSSIKKDTVEDGILTAYEISNLDLNYCELVVLSACQIGLGEIKGNEGVFGLQRAFKMAGVKNIIMSLWSVPDFQTQEFMKQFYVGFTNGKSVDASLKEAQKVMAQKYSPYYWAGFVLVQ